VFRLLPEAHTVTSSCHVLSYPRLLAVLPRLLAVLYSNRVARAPLRQVAPNNVPPLSLVELLWRYDVLLSLLLLFDSSCCTGTQHCRMKRLSLLEVFYFNLFTKTLDIQPGCKWSPCPQGWPLPCQLSLGSAEPQLLENEAPLTSALLLWPRSLTIFSSLAMIQTKSTI
jgi:hypothetical protein